MYQITQNTTLGLLACSLLSSPALAKNHHAPLNEVAIELGSQQSDDDNWGMLSNRTGMRSYGIRAGYGFLPTASIVGSYQRGYTSSAVYSSGGSDLFEMDLRVHRFAAGPKVGYAITDWMRPYATVQGSAVLARLRLDSDTEDGFLTDDEPGEHSISDSALGGFAALGFDFIPSDELTRLRPTTYIELGYGMQQDLAFEASNGSGAQVGELSFQGFYINAGIGLRF